MATPIFVCCPNCDAEFKVRDRRTFGKKVRCPDCAVPFVARPPDRPERTMDYDDYVYDDRPRSRRYEEYEPRRPPRPRRRRSSRETENQGLLIALGVVFGLLVLVGGGVLIYFVAGDKSGEGKAVDNAGGLADADSNSKTVADSPRQINAVLDDAFGFQRPPASKPMAWLSPKTQMLVFADVDEVWRSPVVRDLLSQPEAAVLRFQIDQACREMGLPAGESLEAIDSLHVGLEEIEQTGFAQGLAVIRKKTPWDAELVAREENARESAHLGKTYYVGRLLAYYFPDPNTCLLGPRRFVEEAIARGPTPDADRKFAFVSKTDLVIGVVPDDPAVFSKGVDMTGPSFARQVGLASRQIQTAEFKLEVNTEIKLELLWNLTDRDWAIRMANGLQGAIQEVRAALGDLKYGAARLPPEARELIVAIQPVLNSAIARHRGNQATFSARVPAAVIGQITRLIREQQGPRFPRFGPNSLF